MSITNGYVLPHLQVLVPEIGQDKTAKMNRTTDSMKELAARISSEEPETLLIITHHGDTYQNYFHLPKTDGASITLSEYGVENLNIDMKYDKELIDAIIAECEYAGVAAGYEGDEQEQVDHGTAVPMYYIAPEMKHDYKVVRIFVGGFSLVDHYAYGKCIKAAINKLGRKVTVVVSGDMSHKLREDGPFGYSKEAAIFDTGLANVFKTGNFLGLFGFTTETQENAIECILRCACIFAGAVDGKFVRGDVISYDDAFGVGCATCAFTISDPDSDEVEPTRQFDVMLREQIRYQLESKDTTTNEYVHLAKKAVESYILDKKILDTEEIKESLPAEMFDRSAGVFVTINIEKLNRGCMGTYSASQNNVAEEIVTSAIDAAINDPRFVPIDLEELDSLSYQVDILGEFEPIKALSKINVKKHGLFITLGEKTGFVLPNIEGVKDAQQQLQIAMRRSGIKPGDNYNMYRFQTKHFE